MIVAAWLAVGMTLLSDTASAAAARGEPAKTLAALDEEYAAGAQDLLRRCAIEGHEELAAIIEAWPLPAVAGRQIALAIPPSLETPACVETDAARALWNEFLAARRARAAGIFEQAVFAAGVHDRRPTRTESIRPDPDPVPGSCAAIRLLFLALRDDPDHERARAAAGWVRRGSRWEWPAAAQRIDRGEAYDPRFGWMPPSRLARHRAGERSLRGRWVAAADDDAILREIQHGRQFDADHWEIVSTAPAAVTGELAASLEATRLVWLQIFGACAVAPPDLEARLAGRGRALPHTPHSAILCGSRAQYVDELRKLEPRIAITDGIYWQPTATIWCFADPDRPADETVRHEAFHQLFAESRPDLVRPRAEPGRRSGFWAVEAAAIYAESIAETGFGWTIGGRDAGRGPAARRLVATEGHVPLGELVALGREAFQAHDRIADLYDQCGGLADFLMNAGGGRYREPFIEYLVRVYSDTADPDTLARLCRRSLAELDAEYRDFMR